MDLLSLTIVYLRIWKLCDLQFYYEKQRESAREFDVLPMDTARLEQDLREFHESLRMNPSWADDPVELEQDIMTLLSILDLHQSPISEKNLNILDVLRAKAQKKALDYSGQIRLASGTSA